MLEPYANESEILSSYLEKLKENLKWYEIHRNYWDYTETYNDCHWNLNVARHEIAQYYLMREFFPEDDRWKKVKGRNYENYQVYSGSSSGRPWTEMIVYKGTFRMICNYSLFWRIDTDTKAPYISLRLYKDNYSEETKEIYGELWNNMVEAIKQVITNKKLGIEWNSVAPGNKENCKEASVFHYRFDKDVRDNWRDKKKDVLDLIINVNSLFLERINSFERE